MKGDSLVLKPRVHGTEVGGVADEEPLTWVFGEQNGSRLIKQVFGAAGEEGD